MKPAIHTSLAVRAQSLALLAAGAVLCPAAQARDALARPAAPLQETTTAATRAAWRADPSPLVALIVWVQGSQAAPERNAADQATPERAASQPTEAPKPEGSGAKAQAPQAAASPATKPIQVFRDRCLECHDNDGRGGIVRDTLPRVPDFTDAKWHASRSDAELSRSILEGKGKSMPKWKGRLGSVNVMAMVAFVRGFQGGKQVVEDEDAPEPEADQSRRGGANAPSPAQAAIPAAASRPVKASAAATRMFQRFCARCHGANGKGENVRDTLPIIPDFTRSAWHARRSNAQLVVSVLDGKGSQMPAFRGKATTEQIRELITVVRGFNPDKAAQPLPASDGFEAGFLELVKEFEGLRQQAKAISGSSAPAPASPATRPGAPPARRPG
jgi:mono/diheme cytochrome c family protein